MISLVVVLLLLLGLDGAASESEIATLIQLDDASLLKLQADRSMVFFALDGVYNRAYQFNPAGIDERHRPFSTFKIPNLLIGLETGVESSLDSNRAWDQQKRPASGFWPESWQQDQSLLTAFRRSAVWYFRDIALEVGGPVYRDWLNTFGYGNAAAPNGNDLFWLNGPLEISVREQVHFLQRLLEGEFEVQVSSLNALEYASLLEQKQGYRLHGKTGAGPVGESMDGAFEGWLVGWVVRPDQSRVVYALFVEGPSFSSIQTFRRDMTLQLLKQAGIWPD